MISGVHYAGILLVLAVLVLLIAWFWFRGIIKGQRSDLCLAAAVLLPLAYLLENVGQYLLLAMGLATLIIAVVWRTNKAAQLSLRPFTLGILLIILALLRGLIF